MKWRIPHTGLLAACLLFSCLPFLSSVPQACAGSGTIRLSIAFTPGGALDAAARALVKEAEKELGADIIVENVPSGGGMTGVAKVAAARADGSHLAACVSNALIYIPSRNDTPYTLESVEPLLIFGQASPVLVTRPDAPWKDMSSFLEATRNSGRPLRIGVPGLGTPSHIALAMMAAKDPALKWRFIPFGGPGEAETALLGGHVDAAASGAVPRIAGGQLHPLMVLSGGRLPALPDVPSLSDEGFADPGRGDSCFVLLAPAGVQEGKLDALSRAFEKAAGSENYLKTLEGFSVVPARMGRTEAGAFLRQAREEEDAILRTAGIADMPTAASERYYAGEASLEDDGSYP